MKNKRPLKIRKTGILATVLLIAGISYVDASATDHPELKNKIRHKSALTYSDRSRAVYTSQQLFIVEISPAKKSPHKKVNFKAELRDAFEIIYYDNDTTYTELEWTMCANNNCPQPGVYQEGTAAYEQLGKLLIENQKKTTAAKTTTVKK